MNNHSRLESYFIRSLFWPSSLAKLFSLAFSGLIILLQNHFLIRSLTLEEIGHLYLMISIPMLLPFADFGFGNFLFHRVRSLKLKQKVQLECFQSFKQIEKLHLRINSVALLFLIISILINKIFTIIPSYLLFVTLATFISSRYSLATKYYSAIGEQHLTLFAMAPLPLLNLLIILIFVKLELFEFIPVFIILVSGLAHLILTYSLNRRFTQKSELNLIQGKIPKKSEEQTIKFNTLIPSLFFVSTVAVSAHIPRYQSTISLDGSDVGKLTIILSIVMPLTAYIQTISLQKYVVQVRHPRSSVLKYHIEIFLVPLLAAPLLIFVLRSLKLEWNEIVVSFIILLGLNLSQFFSLYMNTSFRQLLFSLVTILTYVIFSCVLLYLRDPLGLEFFCVLAYLLLPNLVALTTVYLLRLHAILGESRG